MSLSVLIFFPLVGVLLSCLVPSIYGKRITLLGAAIVEFLLSVQLLLAFNTQTAALQFVEKHSWINFFGISYFVGVDGLSISLVVLTSLLTVLIFLYAWKKRSIAFLSAFLILEVALIGSFLSIDAVLFYIFFEASLFPMYFIVGLWGGERKSYASYKLLIYTLAGSLFMLLAMLYMMHLTQVQLGYFSSSLLDWYKLDIPFIAGTVFSTQSLLFFAFAIAFAIKIPLFPLHTWLPDAHVEAPTEGSMMLAGVMLKLGVYGFFRFILPIFPAASQYWGWLFIFLGVVGIIYASLVAMSQTDMKKLIAYSSIAHMGYVIVGLFSFTIFGLTGAYYQMLAHGITSSALFFMVGLIYYKTHTRLIKDYGGLASVAPYFSIFFFIFTCASMAVPLTNGFVGEFLILMGAFQASPVIAYFAVSGVVLGASYMLLLYKNVFFGKVSVLYKDISSQLDLNLKEKCILLVFAVMVFAMGIFPQVFLKYSNTSLQYLNDNYQQYNLTLSQGKE
ncbi:MAG: NADH-quinone oxidoreductase subunit M [Bdellovibrionaceae bacterium]|nr:NADH-quinone oxidoreductase subunit M [Pseudobdellovibrionaceae bacterium]